MSDLIQDVTQFNAKQTAKILNLSPKTLQKYRLNGEGPKYIRVSARCVRYVLSDIIAWQAARRVSSTSDPGPAEQPPSADGGLGGSPRRGGCK